jgi:flagellar motor switch protein FliN/FliY
MSGKVKTLELLEEQPAAQQVKLQEIEVAALGNNLYNGNLSLIKNLKVRLEVFVGGTEISVGELFDLKENATLTLDRMTNEPLELRLDGKPVARGSLVAVGDNFGICITEIKHGPVA